MAPEPADRVWRASLAVFVYDMAARARAKGDGHMTLHEGLFVDK